MKEKYRNYIEKDHSFDKKTMIGIFSLIIVITGQVYLFFYMSLYFIILMEE